MTVGEGFGLRRVGGGWQCALCGQVLAAPADRQPTGVLIGVSGQRNLRALYVDGIEIHRCPMKLGVDGGP